MHNARKDILEIFLEAQHLPAQRRTTRWSGELKRKFARSEAKRRRQKKRRQYLFSKNEAKLLHALQHEQQITRAGKWIARQKHVMAAARRLEARGYVELYLRKSLGKGRPAVHATLLKPALRWLRRCEKNRRSNAKRKRRWSFDQRPCPDDTHERSRALAHG